MSIKSYLSGIIWRTQLLASFIALNIFPLIAVLVVNGTLLATSQGAEILNDMREGYFIQDLSPWTDAQASFVALVVVLFGATLWNLCILLCDGPSKETQLNFVRVRTDVPEAAFLRNIGPWVIGLSATLPLLLVTGIKYWAVGPSLGDNYGGPDQVLLLERMLLVAKLVLAFMLFPYLLLFEQCVQLKASAAKEKYSAGRMKMMRVGFALAIFSAIICLLCIPQPSLKELTPETIHGGGMPYYESTDFIPSGILFVIFIALIYTSRNYWLLLLKKSWSAPRRTTFSHMAFSCVSLAAFAHVFFLIWSDSVVVPQKIGALGVLVGAVGFWAHFLSLLTVVLPRLFGGPSLAILPLLCALLFSGLNNNHEVDAIVKLPRHSLFGDYSSKGMGLGYCFKDEEEKAIRELDSRLLDWIEARIPGKPSNTPTVSVPLLIVAASGGGIRAAAFTAETLLQLDQLTKGEIGNHIFAMSNVSGASLGASVWIRARSVALKYGHSPDDVSTISKGIVDSFFEADYISPAIAGLLVRDTAQMLLPFRLPGGDRARVLEEAWNQSWDRSLSSQGLLENVKERFGLLSELSPSDRSVHSAPPVVVFNATEINTGKRFLVGSTPLPPSWFPDAYQAISPCSLYGIQDMSLSTAAHLSARFTLVSPAATIRSRTDYEAMFSYWKTIPGLLSDDFEPSVPWGQVVDGGYFENYGATTARELAAGVASSFFRLQKSGRISENVRLMIIGLSLVNDPLDLGNYATNSVRQVRSETYNIHQVAATGGNAQVVTQSTPRYDNIWPVAGSYDARELKGLLGEVTPIKLLVDESKFFSEILAPVMAVLHTRESRGLTAERQFAELLQEFGSDNTPVDGMWLDARLGRMLRDDNLLTFTQGGDFGLSPKQPSIGAGRYAMPNPGLAWYLSKESRYGMGRAILEISGNPPRYGADRELARIAKEFMLNLPSEPQAASAE